MPFGCLADHDRDDRAERNPLVASAFQLSVHQTGVDEAGNIGLD